MPKPLLFVGDMHLGRTPHDLAHLGLSVRKLGPAEAWRRVVDYAIEAGVQAVVLAGDVVDRDKDRFEAWSVLHTGVERLVDADIEVIGVAGNHDAVALPKLAARVPAFRLLGQSGKWERAELDGVDLIGWSFPATHHRANPTDAPGWVEATAGRRAGVAGVGLLHADLGATRSSYAPVSTSDLVGAGLSAWFLGHIHTPGDLSEAPFGYLGSLVGLDRGETGRRGPWFVEVGPGEAVAARQLPLGPVHWTELNVGLDGLDAGGDAADAFHAAIDAAIRDAAADDEWIRDGKFSAVGCAVRFTGRTGAGRELRAFMNGPEGEDLVFESGGVQWAVVRFRDRTRPQLDLERLAKENSPVGRLAELVGRIDREGLEAVPEPVRTALDRFDAARWVADTAERPLPDRVETVRAAALRMLDTLRTGRDAEEAP